LLFHNRVYRELKFSFLRQNFLRLLKIFVHFKYRNSVSGFEVLEEVFLRIFVNRMSTNLMGILAIRLWKFNVSLYQFSNSKYGFFLSEDQIYQGIG